jgi:hypothetical protein
MAKEKSRFAKLTFGLYFYKDNSPISELEKGIGREVTFSIPFLPIQK